MQLIFVKNYSYDVTLVFWIQKSDRMSTGVIEKTSVEVELTFEAFRLPKVIANQKHIKESDGRKSYFGPLPTEKDSVHELEQLGSG